MKRTRTYLVAALALVLAGCGDLTGVGVGMGGRDLEILWPRDNAVLRDIETIRARVRGYDLDDYEIYWYVDDSREYRMRDAWDERPPYKYDVVDTWYWDWRGRGPYTVGFIAEDRRGREIARRTVRVYVE